MTVKYISETGKREHNEDSYLVMPEAGVYMVCDGVGGAARGEKASSLCCETFRQFFSRPEAEISGQAIQSAVLTTESVYDDYISHNPEANGMASTMAFLGIKGSTAYIAHAGDSRVYFVRDGKILFQTTDHSLVNEMVASGYITAEEAVNHSKKNQITRALQGSSSHVTADIHIITNVAMYDYFFLCSDGVLEAVSDRFIAESFKQVSDPDLVMQQIKERCAASSKDNFTCIIIKMQETGKIVLPKPAAVNEISPPVRPVKRKKAALVLLLLVLAAAVTAFVLLGKKNGGKDTPVIPVVDTAEKNKVPEKITPNIHEHPAVKPVTEPGQGNTGKKDTKKEGNNKRDPDTAHKITDPAKKDTPVTVTEIKPEPVPENEALSPTDYQQIKYIIQKNGVLKCNDTLLDLHRKIQNASDLLRRDPVIVQFEKIYLRTCKQKQ